VTGFVRSFRNTITAEDLPPDVVIFGRTEAMQDVGRRLRAAIATNLPILIQGESGTGKDIFAKLVHLGSARSRGPFIKVSCPSVPSALMESELFGYDKGAFTGAYADKPGRVEMANAGTLFLDEIGELDAGLQAKLLQILQDGAFCRIGGQEEKRTAARVVCATNRNLKEEIEAGTFRRDLYYRINVISVELPPMRQRLADIPLLVGYFLDLYNAKFTRQAPPLHRGLIEALQQYRWPGNIRELENLIRRYVIVGDEAAIYRELKMGDAIRFDPEIPLHGPICLKKVTRQAIDELERKIIVKVLEANNHNRKLAAQALNISYRSLLYKIGHFGIAPARIHRESARVCVMPQTRSVQ
jgi:two-component system, NtrC family, response regulator AtoC